MPKWYTDRSRYETGFACPWQRLLRYHAQGTGWAKVTEDYETMVGHLLHAGMESVLTKAKEKGSPLVVDEVIKITSDLAYPIPLTTNALAEVQGLIHVWARNNLPWLMRHYDILSAEQELSVDIGNDIVWMARPDCIVRHKETGLPCVVEFKSTRSKPDTIGQLNAYSLQSIMNAYAVSSTYNQPCGEVQIHVLSLGTEKWPTPLTHAYYRPGQPPYVTEDWQARPRRPDGTWLGKLYRKVAVSEHRPISDWAWSMPVGVLADIVPITIAAVEPKIQGLKVMQAISSILLHESRWRDLISSIDWNHHTYSEVAERLPRSFQCVQYSRICDYYNVCFEPDNHSSAFLNIPRDFLPRTPHHPQEGQDG